MMRHLKNRHPPSTTRTFVDVVIHSYRVRFDYVAADPAYAEIEAELAKQPIIRCLRLTWKVWRTVSLASARNRLRSEAVQRPI